MSGHGGNGRDRSSGGQRPGGGHRPPPPDATGGEARYLAELQDACATVVVHLLDGTTVSGVIVRFDADRIELAPARGPELVLRKSDVRYIVANEG